MNDEEKRDVFPRESVDWGQLETIGIFREDLEQAGQLERLLGGRQTEAVPLCLMLRGVSLELDATLQLVLQDEAVVVEIRGIAPAADC